MTESVERTGEVIRFTHGRAQVRLEPTSGCGGCASRGACASGSATPQLIEMTVPPHTQAGDRVSVSIPAASLTLAALLGYMLPPVSLLLGAITANLLFGSDLAAVLGAGLGLVAGVLIARLASGFAFGRNFSSAVCRPDFQPGEHP